MDDTVSEEAIEAGRGYDTLYVPAVFGRWTKHLVKGIGLSAGQTILDVACGSGVLARHALDVVGETGAITGVDPAPGMIAAAREVEPRITWVTAAAEELPFDDRTFDAVVSQFGMMFFTDRLSACREMNRVLIPRGRIAMAVWNTLDHNPAYRDVSALLDAEVGSAAGDAVRLPFCLGDASVVARWLEEAGFSGIKVETRTEQAVFPSLRTMIDAELRGWLPLFDINLDDTTIETVLQIAETKLSAYAAPTGEAVFPTSAHVVTAQSS